MLHETSLAGTWSFALDAQTAVAVSTILPEDLADVIELPGSVDLARKTPENFACRRSHLTRRHPYVGLAWYARDFDVPAEASGMFHHLVLERVHGDLTVWLDGLRVGRDESLSAECRFLLGALAAGRHRLTLAIDNRRFEAVGDANAAPGLFAAANAAQGLADLAHSTTDHTQTNWNGVIGRMAIEAAHARISKLRVDAPSRRLRLHIELEAYDSDQHRPRFWTQPADDRLLMSFTLAGREQPWTCEYGGRGCARRDLAQAGGGCSFSAAGFHGATRRSASGCSGGNFACGRVWYQ